MKYLRSLPERKGLHLEIRGISDVVRQECYTNTCRGVSFMRHQVGPRDSLTPFQVYMVVVWCPSISSASWQGLPRLKAVCVLWFCTNPPPESFSCYLKSPSFSLYQWSDSHNPQNKRFIPDGFTWSQIITHLLRYMNARTHTHKYNFMASVCVSCFWRPWFWMDCLCVTGVVLDTVPMITCAPSLAMCRTTS